MLAYVEEVYHTRDVSVWLFNVDLDVSQRISSGELLMLKPMILTLTLGH